MSQPTNETPICEQVKFRISWRDGAYYVSKPNYEGGEVIPLADAKAIERAANALADALRSSDNHEFGCHIRATKALAAFASLKGAKG